MEYSNLLGFEWVMMDVSNSRRNGVYLGKWTLWHSCGPYGKKAAKNLFFFFEKEAAKNL